MTAASIEDLHALDLRVGTVRSVRPNEGARVPAFVLEVDFGELGLRTTSAQLTQHYDEESLLGRQVIAVLGLPPRRVNGVKSEILVLGAVEDGVGTRLLAVDLPVSDGTPVA